MRETSVEECVLGGRGVRLGAAWRLALAGLIGAAGCGNELAARELPALPQQSSGNRGAPVAQRDAAGGFFAAVHANGTGCPAGSWDASISDDGQAFTIRFNAYETQVDETTPAVVKNCNISLKLESPKGLTFAIPTIYYSGYAFLEEGVKGTQSATYSFRDTGLSVAQKPRELVGPYDADFVFEHGGNRVWAACGTRSVVNVNTQLRLQNTTSGKNGYMNIAAIDDNAKIIVTLAWRPCQAPASVKRDAGTAPGGTIRTAGADGARSAGVTVEDAEVWATPAVTPR